MAVPNGLNPFFQGVVESKAGLKMTHGKGVLISVISTNGTTPVSVFGTLKTDPVEFLPTITGLLIVAKDTTMGTITLAGTQGTIAALDKGVVAQVVRGATSLSTAALALTDTLVITSNTAGDAFVFITYKVS